MINAVIMTARDHVVTVTQDIAAGEVICARLGDEEFTVTALAPIPLYHKAALVDIPQGASVIKYGEHIGYATAPIRAGEHVHTQNLGSTPEGGK